jgi:aryl sulfotransferase
LLLRLVASIMLTDRNPNRCNESVTIPQCSLAIMAAFCLVTSGSGKTSSCTKEKIKMLPSVERTYQNHHIDSTRWVRYQPRAGDIVISTSIRSGTTWSQQIVRQLILWDRPDEILARTLQMDASPWLDYPGEQVDTGIALLEAQQHRRYIKTHLPLDGLPYYPQVRYIVVARDARDVFMSLFNFYTNFSDEYLALTNENPQRIGPPLPACPADVHQAWRDWITRGWFEWESEGYPFWGNLHHTQTWWNFRHLENILFVHYNDLLNALPTKYAVWLTFWIFRSQLKAQPRCSQRLV